MATGAYSGFKSRFKVGDSITISGGPAWIVCIMDETEKLVILKRWKSGRCPGWDYDMLTEECIQDYYNQIRRCDNG